MKILITTLLALIFSGSLLAHNNLFLPGDSFFGTAISEKGLEVDGDERIATFDYQAFSGTFMLCGYAGYGSLKLLQVPASFEANLNKAESLENKELSEAKILFYGRGFDYEKFSIGLKYNEDWATDQRRAGKHHLIYNGFEDPELILLDWQDAESVSYLPIEPAPPLLMWEVVKRGKGKKKGYVAREPEHPVRLKFDKCLVVLVWDSLEALARKEDGSSFLVIDGGHLRRFTYEKDAKGNFNHLVETTEASSATQ